MRQRLRIAGRPRQCGHAKRRERFERHHPRRYRSSKALAKKGSERLILPRLYVACRPVVEEANAEHMALGVSDRNRCAERVAATDNKPDLELEIKTLRWAKIRRAGVRGFGLTERTHQRMAARTQ